MIGFKRKKNCTKARENKKILTRRYDKTKYSVIIIKLLNKKASKYKIIKR